MSNCPSIDRGNLLFLEKENAAGSRKSKTTVAVIRQRQCGVTLVVLMIGLSLLASIPSTDAIAVSKSWSVKAPRPGPAQEGLGAAAVGNTVFAIGGNIEAARNDAFDALTNTWSAKTPVPTGRVEAAGVIAVGGLIYVISGLCRSTCSPNVMTNAVEVYDPAANTWSVKAPIPTARNRAGVVALNGKIYVIGGYVISPSAGPFNTVEVYDIATNSWTTRAAMPTAREGLLAIAVREKIYAIGGLTSPRDGSSATNAVEVYDPATDSWSIGLAPMPTARGLIMGDVLCGDTAFVVGGFDGTGARNVNEAYFPATNGWTRHAAMPTARAEGGAAVVGNTIYVIGGGKPPEVSQEFDTNVNEAYTVSCRTADVPILRQFQAPIRGNGRGIAIIGSQIFFTLAENANGLPDTNIYVTDLFGNLQRTLNVGVTLGSLDWDGTQVWAGSYDGADTIYTIDPATGTKTSRFSFLFTDTNCFGGKGFIDGLAYAGGTLWFSGDGASVVWHTDLSGNILGSITLSSMCNTGVAFDGSNLWLMMYSLPKPDDKTAWDAVIQKRSTSGSYLWAFRPDGLLYEDLGYDAVSFAPKCAVWGITANDRRIWPTITALEVPCSTPSLSAHDIAVVGAGTMTPATNPGSTVEIDVWTLNNGTSFETFSVSVSVGTTQIGPVSVSLESGQTSLLTFTYTASATGTFSITATASTVPGETNTSNNVLDGGTLTVTQFDFSLSNSGSIIVNPGGSGSNTITVTLISGPSDGVSLSCTSGLPSGASCSSLNPPSGVPTFSSTLTITTSASTPTGSFAITVTGTGGGQSRSTQFTLRVGPPSSVGGVGGYADSIDKFTLLAPYVGLAFIIAAATVAVFYVKSVKNREEKQ